MSVAAPRAGGWLARGGALRRYLPIVVLVGIFGIFNVFMARNQPSGLPLDPRSADAAGTKALVLVLERAGADVTLLNTPAEADTDTLLVLVDNYDSESADAVRSFVAAGGTAVVADYSGSLSDDLRQARNTSVALVAPELTRQCDLPALAGAERVAPGSATMFAVPDDAVGCYRRGSTAWLIARDRGEGTMVTIGGAAFLTNALLGEQDNAVVAAALLAPQRGTSVGIVKPSFIPQGQPARRSLNDLIPDRVVAAALQLLIAFGVVVLWRARRLGKPVREVQAVRLAGSEIVIALGNLLQRTGSRDRAAELLRADLRRTLSEQIGAPGDLPAEDVAEIAAQRTAVNSADVVRALTGTVAGGDAGLVELAQLVERIRDDIKAPSSATAGVGSARTH